MNVAERLADGDVLCAEPPEDTTYPEQYVRQVRDGSYEALREGHSIRQWTDENLRWVLDVYESVEFVTSGESPFTEVGDV